MKAFHHIGLVTQTEKPGEMYFESLKVWGTNPDDERKKKPGIINGIMERLEGLGKQVTV